MHVATGNRAVLFLFCSDSDLARRMPHTLALSLDAPYSVDCIWFDAVDAGMDVLTEATTNPNAPRPDFVVVDYVSADKPNVATLKKIADAAQPLQANLVLLSQPNPTPLLSVKVDHYLPRPSADHPLQPELAEIITAHLSAAANTNDNAVKTTQSAAACEA